MGSELAPSEGFEKSSTLLELWWEWCGGPGSDVCVAWCEDADENEEGEEDCAGKLARDTRLAGKTDEAGY